MKMRRLFMAVSFSLAVTISGWPEENQPCRKAEQYPDPEPVNMVYPGSLVLGRVYGRAVIQAGERIYPGSQLRGEACLSLFTENSHKFVATVPVDKSGRFEFSGVPPGSYRLVARSPGFCTGNIPVRVSGSRKSKRILVFFQGPAIDVCTTADYDHK